MCVLVATEVLNTPRRKKDQVETAYEFAEFAGRGRGFFFKPGLSNRSPAFHPTCRIENVWLAMRFRGSGFSPTGLADRCVGLKPDPQAVDLSCAAIPMDFLSQT